MSERCTSQHWHRIVAPLFPLPESASVVDARIGDHGPALLTLEDGSVFPGVCLGCADRLRWRPCGEHEPIWLPGDLHRPELRRPGGADDLSADRKLRPFDRGRSIVAPLAARPRSLLTPPQRSRKTRRRSPRCCASTASPQSLALRRAALHAACVRRGRSAPASPRRGSRMRRRQSPQRARCRAGRIKTSLGRFRQLACRRTERRASRSLR